MSDSLDKLFTFSDPYSGLGNITSHTDGRGHSKKYQLTKKQKKKRAASKRAKKARKNNR